MRPGPGIVVTSVIVCYALFGFGGVNFSVTLYYYLDVAYREIQTRLLVRKGLPTSNSYYLALEELPVTNKKGKAGANDAPASTPDGERNDDGMSAAPETIADESMPMPDTVDSPATETASPAPTDDACVYVTDHYLLAEQDDISATTATGERMPIPDDVQPDPQSGQEPEVTDGFPIPTELPKPDVAAPSAPKKTGFWSFRREKKK